MIQMVSELVFINRITITLYAHIDHADMWEEGITRDYPMLVQLGISVAVISFLRILHHQVPMVMALIVVVGGALTLRR